MYSMKPGSGKIENAVSNEVFVPAQSKKAARPAICIVVAVSHEFALPIRYIGVGESIDDLRDFDPQEFTDALFQT